MCCGPENDVPGDWMQHCGEMRMSSLGNIGVTSEGRGTGPEEGLVSLGLM